MHATIGRFTQGPVVTVEANSFVRDSLTLMNSHNIGFLVVLAEGSPAGILTERDIVFAANWMLGQPELQVGEVINKQVVTAELGTTVREACEYFRDRSVRHLVVVDRSGQLSGVFTQTDLIRALDRQAFAEDIRIAALMTPRVLQVSPETSARYALSLMARHAVSGVLVVDEQKPVGFFTEKHVLRLIANDQDLNEFSVGQGQISPAIAISDQDHPVQAISLMKKKSVRRLLVLDHEKLVNGVLTRTDLSRGLQCCRLLKDVSDSSPHFNQPAVDSSKLYG